MCIKRVLGLMILFISHLSIVYASGPIDLRPYLKQANQLYNQMTLDEKIGQMLLPSYSLLATSVKPPSGKAAGYRCQQALNQVSTDQQIIKACGLNQIVTYHLGAVLQAGGPNYNAPTLKNWQNFNKLAQQVHKSASHDPLLLIGNDAIHGNTHVAGSVVFPQNIGLGATHDPRLVQKIGQLVANDSLISGFNWVYMPTVALAQDLRWGRSYESFSQDPAWIRIFSMAYISGLQEINDNQIKGVLASVKHFMGDGATEYGLDEGNVQFNGTLHQFWLENGLGYEGAIEAGALNLMVSYSAINYQRMHYGGQWNLLNRFKNQGITGSDNQTYQFSGFAVSDYNGATRAAYFYNQRHPAKPLEALPQKFAQAVNAGVDMLMLGTSDTTDPFNPDSSPNYTTIGQAFNALKEAYNQKLIPESRLHDAVTRILAVKLAMASQEKITDYDQLQAQERKIALAAVEESLVLLKNNNKTLPLTKSSIKHVILFGDVDDVGIQNGGWTINWQGQKGNQYYEGADKLSSGATTLLDALKTSLGSDVDFIKANKVSAYQQPYSAKDTVVISVLAEPPYAEYMGDIGNASEADQWYNSGIKTGQNKYMPARQSHSLALKWRYGEANQINELHQRGFSVITVVYSGRPMVLNEGGFRAPLPHSDVVIAAFLPGTLGGQAIVNAMLGEYRFGQNGFSNRLNFPWPRNMEDVVTHFSEGALYPVGWGLSIDDA